MCRVLLHTSAWLGRPSPLLYKSTACGLVPQFDYRRCKDRGAKRESRKFGAENGVHLSAVAFCPH